MQVHKLAGFRTVLLTSPITPNPRLSERFFAVPTSSGNRGWTVIAFSHCERRTFCLTKYVHWSNYRNTYFCTSPVEIYGTFELVHLYVGVHRAYVVHTCTTKQICKMNKTLLLRVRNHKWQNILSFSQICFCMQCEIMPKHSISRLF